jgi:hypothetical protein
MDRNGICVILFQDNHGIFRKIRVIAIREEVFRDVYHRMLDSPEITPWRPIDCYAEFLNLGDAVRMKKQVSVIHPYG